MHIQRQSAYLVGRDKTIVDIPVDHPSCSKQHAVIQCTPTPPLPLHKYSYSSIDRYIQTRDEFGESKGSVK
jgi:smad nuclear-interacting protein 1